MEITLEKELKSRLFIHKMAIASSYLIKDYIDKELAKGGIQLPIGIIQRDAEEMANKKVQQAMLMGTFEDLYNVAWEKLAPIMPEHTKVL